ncbi:hypothetical protein BDR05DRAFT_953805 [Suillus weaverae]|nr:hypothetical protein BDR05DRAFT_953805 [Suillus weaverae]
MSATSEQLEGTFMNFISEKVKSVAPNMLTMMMALLGKKNLIVNEDCDMEGEQPDEEEEMDLGEFGGDRQYWADGGGMDENEMHSDDDETDNDEISSAECGSEGQGEMDNSAQRHQNAQRRRRAKRVGERRAVLYQITSLHMTRLHVTHCDSRSETFLVRNTGPHKVLQSAWGVILSIKVSGVELDEANKYNDNTPADWLESVSHLAINNYENLATPFQYTSVEHSCACTF